MYIGLYVKYRYTSQILIKPELSRQIFKNTDVSDFIKIRPVGAVLFHADGQTDRHGEANSRFPQFFESD
jgi:hypothetical protein